MADATALERRNGSTAQYQASWIEHPVRYVSHRIKPVTLLPCLLIARGNLSRVQVSEPSACHPAAQRNAQVSSSNEEIWPLRTGQQRQSLKHAQQFEHDDDNHNDSNYVEDVSVHIATPIRVSSRWRDFSDEWDRLY
jgi:hypothetical protein